MVICTGRFAIYEPFYLLTKHTTAMISIISDEVLEAAREMNRRDVRRAEGVLNDDDREIANADSPMKEDDKIWAKYQGITGLKGVRGKPIKVGSSHYSYGPYSRNRRILADVALAAGWDVEKARHFEERCVTRMAIHEKNVVALDLSDPNEPRLKNGRPFTFQNIPWPFLRRYIEAVMRKMDPDKRRDVKAAVLNLYEVNSKTGKKVLPAHSPGLKRISDDDLPVYDADLKRAQDELDRIGRPYAMLRMAFDRRYVPPVEVKKDIKDYLLSSSMSKEDFCRATDVTEDEFDAFMLKA